MRVRRHLFWARTQGVGRLIEEDDLDPFRRASLAIGKARWRARHDHRPDAVPVFLVGVQRSGTNMLVRGLEREPSFEVRNENDREAFDRFLLRSDEVVRGIVTSSKHRYVLFKPLCDSHRIGGLLDDLGTPSSGRAIWAHRGVDGRVRSAVDKFGDANLQALRRIADGTGDGLWQAQGLTDEHRATIRSFDLAAMGAEDAAALFWYLRNDLYFTTGLDARGDVTMVSYERMVADPATVMRSLCRFLGMAYRPELIAHVRARTPSDLSLRIDPRIRALCDELGSRLDVETARRTGA
jgi:hypothetical protein